MKKKSISIFAISVIILISACKRNRLDCPNCPKPDVKEFLSSKTKPIETFSIDASTGGNFTTLQGTYVTIPANAFVDENNTPITGTVTINFKDIYKKSDMLLNQMPTMFIDNTPMNSGGEFYIKVTYNNAQVNLSQGKQIRVKLAALSTINTQMLPMSLSEEFAWNTNLSNGLSFDSTNYYFDLNSLDYTWYNADHPLYSDVPLTTIKASYTVSSADNFDQNFVQSFIIFKDINGVISFSGQFNYAPLSVNCTIVGVSMDNEGDLYTAFTPITISENMNLNIELIKTSEEKFISRLQSLD